LRRCEQRGELSADLDVGGLVFSARENRDRLDEIADRREGLFAAGRIERGERRTEILHLAPVELRGVRMERDRQLGCIELGDRRLDFLALGLAFGKREARPPGTAQY
jgi:hypothetical protein